MNASTSHIRTISSVENLMSISAPKTRHIELKGSINSNKNPSVYSVSIWSSIFPYCGWNGWMENWIYEFLCEWETLGLEIFVEFSRVQPDRTYSSLCLLNYAGEIWYDFDRGIGHTLKWGIHLNKYWEYPQIF